MRQRQHASRRHRRQKHAALLAGPVVLGAALAVWLSSHGAVAWAQEPDPTTCCMPTPGAGLLSLAEDPRWRALLHYEASLGGGWTSRARSDAFFLSATGRTRPRDELEANLRALCAERSTQGTARVHDPSPLADGAFSCRFPARSRFLTEQLGLSFAPGGASVCPAFTAWRTQRATGAVSLVFATGAMQRPSTLFGHTFLKLDHESSQNSDLLAETISYTVAPSSQHAPLFVVQALVGTLDAVYDVQPYYSAIKRYADIEGRDLWTYRLRLTDAQLAALLAHLWEVRTTHFDYAFFDTNCAKALLSLVDMAAPGHDLAAQLGLYAIPLDAVHILGRTPSLWQSSALRPALVTQVEARLAMLSAEEGPCAMRLAEPCDDRADECLEDVAMTRHAYVLDTADALLRLRCGTNALADAREGASVAARRARSLLEARARLGAVSQAPLDEGRQAASPHRGHATTRMRVGAAAFGHSIWAECSVRAALHDLLDAPRGYAPWSALEVMHLQLGASLNQTKASDASMQAHLDIVRMTALRPWTAWHRPLSWRGALAVHTQAQDRFWAPSAGRMPLFGAPVLRLEAGLGTSHVRRSPILQNMYWFVDAVLETGPGLPSAIRLTSSPAAGIVARLADTLSARLEVSVPILLTGLQKGQARMTPLIRMQLAFAPTPRFAIRWEAGLERASYTARASTLYYF